MSNKKILQSGQGPSDNGAEKVGLIFGLILQQEKVELILQPQRTGRTEKVGLIFGLILQQEKVELILQPQRTGRNNEIFLIYSFAQRTGRTGRSECPSDNV